MRAFGAVILLAMGTLSAASLQEREMTYEHYLTELNAVIAREKNAREGIAREQALIENLKQQIARIHVRIASVIRELYALIGITEQDLLNAESELEDLSAVFQQFLLSSGEDLLRRKSDIKLHAERFDALRKKRVCLLSRLAARVREVDAAVVRVLAMVENATGHQRETGISFSSSSYTVGTSGRARNLWELAEEVYNDQYQWPRIYRANKKRIDRRFERYKSGAANGGIRRPQDFLVPGWTLEIPR
ncbi:MAG: hypothetical protein JXA71_19965 [Chitinispirillaceae bacterium]|nr:hypothetical protein [Chitinispirillaceae bacterium]